MHSPSSPGNASGTLHRITHGSANTTAVRSCKQDVGCQPAAEASAPAPTHTLRLQAHRHRSVYTKCGATATLDLCSMPKEDLRAIDAPSGAPACQGVAEAQAPRLVAAKRDDAASHQQDHGVLAAC